jgi:hypothetical protein
MSHVCQIVEFGHDQFGAVISRIQSVDLSTLTARRLV